VIHRIDRAASPTVNRSGNPNPNPFLSPAEVPNNDAEPPPYPATSRVLKNVFVQDAGRTYTLNDVPLSITIEDFFGRLKDEKQLPPESIRVIFGGKELAGGRGRTLGDYNVQNESTLQIVVSLVGGEMY
jgi:Ubiquitin family